jgi:hypothetical protein
MAAVLTITLASVIAIAFAGTILVLLAISAISMSIGFVGAFGLILRWQLITTSDYKFLEAAEAKARKSNQMIHATIINQTVVRGRGDGDTENILQIEGAAAAGSTKKGA